MDPISRSIDWRSQPSKRWFQSDLSHPMLLLGIRRDTSQSVDSALRDLASLVEPHLQAHILNWHLRSKQTASSERTASSEHDANSEQAASSDPLGPPTLPSWLVMFGFLYRGGTGDGSITIVAHIPYITNEGQDPDIRRTYSYLSLIVDHIPLPGLAHQPDPSDTSSEHDDNSPVICNIRAALALLSLKLHAVRLADAWEGVQWPPFVYEMHSDAERERLGSFKSPSERYGYTAQDMFPLNEEPLTTSEQEDELAEERYEQAVAMRKSKEIVKLWARKVEFGVPPLQPKEEDSE